MIKLFASDLDGTLLTDHIVDNAVLNTIQTILDNGRSFAIVTGRPMYSIQRHDMGLDTLGIYTICMNGAITLDPDGKKLDQLEISKTFLSEVLYRFPGLMIECFASDRTYIRQNKEDYIEYINHSKARNAELFLPDFLKIAEFAASDNKILQANIMKINAHIVDSTQATIFNNFIQANRNVVINRPSREDVSGIFEITAINASKERAIEVLLKHLGYAPNEVAIYGDGPNDIEMLRQFPNSFAPENAPECVKHIASKVIGPCSNHAVPKHMYHTLMKEVESVI